MESGRLIEIVRQWVMKADHDLEIVRRDISSPEPLTDVLCFHCQQAVEKYLKAFLVYNQIKPPRTHIKEIKAIRKSFGLTQDEFSELLGGGAKAFARYENGTVLQSKPMDNLLRGLREYPEMINLYKKHSLKVA